MCTVKLEAPRGDRREPCEDTQDQRWGSMALCPEGAGGALTREASGPPSPLPWCREQSSQATGQCSCRAWDEGMQHERGASGEARSESLSLLPVPSQRENQHSLSIVPTVKKHPQGEPLPLLHRASRVSCFSVSQGCPGIWRLSQDRIVGSPC